MKTSPNDPPAPRKRGKAVFLIQNKRFFTESWGSRQGLRRSAKKAARGRSMKARPTQSRKGVKGQLPLAGCRDSVPAGVWGNAPTVFRALNSKEEVNKRRRQRSVPASNFALPQERPQAALPQDSVKNKKGRSHHEERPFALLFTFSAFSDCCPCSPSADLPSTSPGSSPSPTPVPFPSPGRRGSSMLCP